MGSAPLPPPAGFLCVHPRCWPVLGMAGSAPQGLSIQPPLCAVLWPGGSPAGRGQPHPAAGEEEEPAVAECVSLFFRLHMGVFFSHHARKFVSLNLVSFDFR